MEQIENSMKMLADRQAQNLQGADYSLASLKVLQRFLQSRPARERDYLVASAYFGEVLRRRLSGQWVSSSARHRSKSGAPLVQFAQWFLDPLFQIRLIMKRDDLDLEERAESISEAIAQGTESTGVTKNFEFPTAWQHIRSTFMAYRVRRRIATSLRT